MEFKKLKNVRPLNYEGVKPNRLYRGESLFRLSKKDRLVLEQEIGIKVIIDLRTSQEATKKKDSPVKGALYYSVPLVTMEEMGANSEREGKRNILKEHKLPDIREYYARLVSEERKVAYTKIFDLLLEADGPIYFHCTVGKDRTGTLSALILNLLGVDIKTIYEDYLETNDHPVIPFAYKVFALFLDKSFRREFMEYFKAKEELLDITFETIEEKYGGLTTFYKEICGLDEKKIEAFKQKYGG